jgi:hypothetical protein
MTLSVSPCLCNPNTGEVIRIARVQKTCTKCGKYGGTVSITMSAFGIYNLPLVCNKCMYTWYAAIPRGTMSKVYKSLDSAVSFLSNNIQSNTTLLWMS